MKMNQVESSTIAARGYDAEIQTMHVQFKTDSTRYLNPVYEYAGVPLEVWENWCKSESAGKFFASDIKPRYKGVKLSEELPVAPPTWWMEKIADEIVSKLSDEAGRALGGRDFVVQKLREVVSKAGGIV